MIISNSVIGCKSYHGGLKSTADICTSLLNVNLNPCVKGKLNPIYNLTVKCSGRSSIFDLSVNWRITPGYYNFVIREFCGFLLRCCNLSSDV